MNIDFNIGISIACVCIFIVVITLIVVFGGCKTIEEDIGLTAYSSENNIVENPIHNI